MFVTRDHLRHSGVGCDGQPIRLSLCMIVRDNAPTLRPCLASIRPWVDEMVVVDTGSTDETPAIAQEFGARLFHFPWCDDFSAARNESLRHARGQWLFWMDSDDTIDTENGRKLRQLACGPHPVGRMAYVMQVHCPAGNHDGPSGLTVVDHVKLFRNHQQIRFEFRIHEQVLPSIRRLGGDVAWTDIFVDHSGSDQTESGRRRKCERDLRILGLELRDRPDHPFVLFNLGMTYSDMSEHERAIRYLTRCLEVSHRDESHVRKAYGLLIASLSAAGRRQEAWEVCLTGLESYPEDPELLFRQGILAHSLGRLQEAEHAYRGALANRDERHFTSVDPGIVGHKARHNLALVYASMGRDDLAEVQWRHALADVSGFAEGRRCLVEGLIRQAKHHAAEVLIEGLVGQTEFRCEALVLQSRLAEARGDMASARHALDEAVSGSPGRPEPVQALCQFLFHHGGLDDAELALQRLVQLCPDDGATHHNLGVIFLRQGRPEQAANCFRQSLRLRPEAVLSWEELAEALDALGSADDAADAREHARRLQQV